MKLLLFSVFLIFHVLGLSQNLQLHYDFRHSIDPEMNSKNFPTFSFEYFKNVDTISTGAFLFKLQADLKGKNNNTGQVFIQVSQSLKFWNPKVYLSLNFSGGLGVTPVLNGFYVSNSYGAGVSFPFQWRGAWFSTNLIFRYNAFRKPSYDPQLNLYYGKGFSDYKVFVSGSFVFWTENRNQGNDYTKNLTGKKFAFFGDPQFWIRIKNGFSVGSRINIYYHLLSDDDQIQLYPTLGSKYQF